MNVDLKENDDDEENNFAITILLKNRKMTMWQNYANYVVVLTSLTIGLKFWPYC